MIKRIFFLEDLKMKFAASNKHATLVVVAAAFLSSSAPYAKALRPRKVSFCDATSRLERLQLSKVEAATFPENFGPSNIGARASENLSNVVGIRGGEVKDVLASPLFWLMVTMYAVRTFEESLPYAKAIEGGLTVALVGMFFAMLINWQNRVQSKSEADDGSA